MKDLKAYLRLQPQLTALMLLMTVLCGSLHLYAESSDRSPVLGIITGEKQEEIDGGSFEEVTLFAKESADSDKKIARKAHFVRYDDAEATVVMCHGFMCDKQDVAFLRRLFPRGKYNVLTFDFRGHGEDRGTQVCTFGRDEIYEVEAAAQYVRNRSDLKGLPCFAYGFSMGAVSAIEAQARNHTLFDGMVLDCPFDSSENVIKQGLNGLKVSVFGYEFNMPGRSLLQKYAFHPHVQAFVKNVLRCLTALNPRDIEVSMCRVYPGESVKKITVPCFFIHCKNDEKIDVESIRTIYSNAACGCKKLWITDGRQHFGSYFHAPERYTDQVREFLSYVLDGSASKQSMQEVIED